MGVLINLASHPVINGFTNAAALIIGLSLLNSFINVPMPRSDMFLRDLWHVLMQLHLAHWPTIAFGIGTLAVMSLLKKLDPQASRGARRGRPRHGRQRRGRLREDRGGRPRADRRRRGARGLREICRNWKRHWPATSRRRASCARSSPRWRRRTCTTTPSNPRSCACWVRNRA
jgi:hypothetical protein